MHARTCGLRRSPTGGPQLEWQPAPAGSSVGGSGGGGGRRADVREVRGVRGMSDAEEREFGGMLAPATMLAPEACVVLV